MTFARKINKIPKRLHVFSCLSYDERLKRLNMYNLEHRRLCFDLLWSGAISYYLVSKLVRVNPDDFFTLRPRSTIQATLIRFLNSFAIAPLDPTVLLYVSYI